jgi:phosphoglycolate phosphatase
MKIDSIILDVDGTIWNTTGIVASAWNKVIDENFPQVSHVTADILKGQFGKTMDVIADNLFGVLSAEEKKLLMEKCCIEEQKALLSNTENITYKGVIETLQKLSKRVPLFIVSNCQKGYIELVIEKNGITDLIKDFECFGNNGNSKDENIRLIVKRNGLENPVYVGDTQGDYEACIKAGVPFVWAAYGFGCPNDDKYFAKLEEFAQLEELLP